MPRTLVIDDDPTFRSALVRQLEARGHRTTAVSSIEQALEKKDQAWDLVLCDLYLRDGDGRQMLEALSKTHPEVPVVVLSGSRSMEDVIEVFRAQARDFLRKPLRPAELDAMLERVLVSAAPADSLHAQLDELVQGKRPCAPLVQGGARLLKVLDHEEVDLRELERIVAGDPELVAATLRAAASALRSSQPLTGLRQAVVRLGIQGVTEVARAAAVSTSLPISNHRVQVLSRSIWANACATGMAARHLAARTGLADPSLAHLAGLLHNIGELALAHCADGFLGRRPPSADEESTLLTFIDREHELVGRQLLSKWGVDAAVVELAGAHHGPPTSPLHRVVLAAWNTAIVASPYLGRSADPHPLKDLGVPREEALAWLRDRLPRYR